MLRTAGIEMKPGDRVIWLCSPGRSILAGWRVQHIPAIVVSICRRRVRIRILHGVGKIVSVEPENLIGEE